MSKLKIFKVFGPKNIKCESRNQVKWLEDKNIINFWIENQQFKDKLGCYVFAMRAGGGLAPYYVGKTIKTFEKECFNPTNFKRFNKVLKDFSKGTPVMYFIIPENTQGATPTKVIGGIEKFLIQLAAQENEDLCNKHHTKKSNWGIKGFTKGVGKESKSSKDFKRLMGIQ